jgi:hypothetical protein
MTHQRCNRRWHSAAANCPDMFWVLTRKLGMDMLGETLLKPFNCTWWMPYERSWWIWHYWRCLPNPLVSCRSKVQHIHGVQGSFSVAGNVAKGRSPLHCKGAPYLQDPLGRLQDSKGKCTWSCCPWKHPHGLNLPRIGGRVDAS